MQFMYIKDLEGFMIDCCFKTSLSSGYRYTQVDADVCRHE